MAAPAALLIMGVSGSGKSTVGALLASELGWKFYDADDYHPEENRIKMGKGIPLTDQVLSACSITRLCHLPQARVIFKNSNLALWNFSTNLRLLLPCSFPGPCTCWSIAWNVLASPGHQVSPTHPSHASSCATSARKPSLTHLSKTSYSKLSWQHIPYCLCPTCSLAFDSVRI
ncbi:probable gluconokinase isoform X2 [Sturnira hondurensis]|uniref:probable gluconokinase isoform X2 n=1 Tax=Sturnira hondurensis TaxID=192404 RepID=UPI00187A0397|nr:probable gluconokinase isoform X2 [Sturnira hondurensis]